MKYTLVFTLVFLAGCPTQGKIGPNNNDCELAEANLKVLGCKDSRGVSMSGPTKTGKMFSEICREAYVRRVDLNPKCIAEAKSCDVANKCPR